MIRYYIYVGAFKFVCKWMPVSNVDEKWCNNVHCSHACTLVACQVLAKFAKTMISFSSSKTHKHHQIAVGAHNVHTMSRGISWYTLYKY